MPSYRTSTTNVRQNILRLMVENAVDAQYLVNLESDEFIACNPALCELLGYSESELIGKDFKTLDIIDERDRAYIQKMRGQNAPSSTRKIRFRFTRQDGESRWVESRTRYAKYMGLDVVIGSARDVTEQIELESRLRTKLDREADRAKASEEKAREAIQSSHRSFQMLETLRALPEFSKLLSTKDRVPELIKEACLFITNRESGLRYASCTIYFCHLGALEVAYANPFRLTSRIEPKDVRPEYQALVNGESLEVSPEPGLQAVAIRTRDGIYGILEVGYGRVINALVASDPELAHAQRHVVLSIADFLGILISNINLRESIHQQVIEDELTGLFNRRRFHEKLDMEFRRAVRYGRDLSLLVLDIDHFKSINDTYGHAQGDVVLRKLGALLKASFRDLDTIARIGGEEIAVIMPETPADRAALKADRVREFIATHGFDLLESNHSTDTGSQLHVSVSIGVAAIASGLESPEHLFQEADRALYIAKNSGRNRVSIA